jgi:hypothetical protein
MLDTLRLVHGSVSTKDLMPVMKHFYIYDERIQGQNGRVALDAPLPGFQVSLTVPADRFLKAIDACDVEPEIRVTDSRVTIRSGSFRATLPIMANDAYPRDTPDALTHRLTAPILPVLRRLSSFISSDASHIWSLGVKILNGVGYATNNVIVVRSRIEFPENLTIPLWAVDEMIRIGSEPVGFGIGYTADNEMNAVTFHYSDGLWLKAHLISQDFPDGVAKVFDDAPDFDSLPEIPDGLQAAIERITPFCPNPKLPVVICKENCIMTDDGDQSAEFSGFTFDEEVRVNAVMTGLILAVATHAQFSSPRMYFSGDNIQGVAATYRSDHGA